MSTNPRSLNDRLDEARAKKAAEQKAASDARRAGYNQKVDEMLLIIDEANTVFDNPSSSDAEVERAWVKMQEKLHETLPSPRRGTAPAQGQPRSNRPNPAPAGNGNRTDNTAETPAVPPPSPAPQEQEGHGQESEVPRRTEATEPAGRPRRTFRQIVSSVADAAGVPPSNRQH